MADPDFLSGTSGTVRHRWLARLGDAVLDRGLRRAAPDRAGPGRKVLILSIVRPDLPGEWPAARAELERSRHDVTVRTREAGVLGKFPNLNRLLAETDPHAYDWLLIVDDDVALPRGFLDAFLGHAEHHRFALAQPAHRLASHGAWAVTRRQRGVVARRTRFVEIGPVTALRRETFDVLLPFPELRWGWGLDAHWAALAEQHDWPVGVVDATPILHAVRPAASTYGREGAVAEAAAFLAERPYVPRGRAQETLETYRA
jgi:hypothetical protein